MGKPRIAFVSREVYPFDSAGLGNYVTFTAQALAAEAEVTIVTSDVHRERYEELAAAGDPRLPAGACLEFVPEPTYPDDDYWYGSLHLWSARAYEALKRLFPGGGPDLAEFPDYLGEAFVTTQAKQTLDPALRNTTVCVRAYTTSEMCAVLDGFVGDDRLTRYIRELERFALRHADHFLWPGGLVLDAYRSFYGTDGIAAPVEVRHPVTPGPAPAPRGPSDGGPVRFLYAGRLERRKGVQNLVRAASGLEGGDWSLTLVGGDTDSAPLGVSMRAQLDLMVAGDPRIEILDRVEREQLRELRAEADVIVSPSIWECWPNTVLEALEDDRPVLATPVGGQVAMVEDGETGWLAGGTDAEALGDALRRVLAAGGRPRDGGGDGAPRRAFASLTDPAPVRDAYLSLAVEGRRRPAPRSPDSPPPLCSIVIPYFEMEQYVEETLRSIAAQTHPRLEVVLVNDGSLRDEDGILAELGERYEVTIVTQRNSGLGQARNLGLDLIRGRYVLPVDPDDELMPTFVERCVDVLEQRPELAYVTAWSEFIDENGDPHEGGYRPIGNAATWPEVENVTGSAMAVIRRRLFERGLRYSPDLTSYEDWLLYMQMRAAGEYGHVIPETLLRYRIRTSSMMRGVAKEKRERLAGEFAAHLKEAEVKWT